MDLFLLFLPGLAGSMKGGVGNIMSSDIAITTKPLDLVR